LFPAWSDLSVAKVSAAGVLNEHDQYDLLLEDMEWLREYNAKQAAHSEGAIQINEDSMELLIDTFEKSAGKLTRSVCHCAVVLFRF
jgi:hypothetical protein